MIVEYVNRGVKTLEEISGHYNVSRCRIFTHRRQHAAGGEAAPSRRQSSTIHGQTDANEDKYLTLQSTSFIVKTN